MNVPNILVIAASIAFGACTSSGSGGDTRSGAGSFDGKVLKSSHPGVVVGTRCMGTAVIRESVADIRIICPNDTEVYNGKGPIHIKGEDEAWTYTDEATTDKDGTPAVRFIAGDGSKPDGQNGTITITDTAKGGRAAFEILIAI